MSSRYYPKFVRGNPQLRIFLPDFPMILVKNPHKKEELNKNFPKNVVHFKTPVRMTDRDIFNYLTKIYKLKVIDVKSQVRFGEIPLAPGSMTEFAPEPAFRLASVYLPKDVEFTHPDEDLFVADGVNDTMSQIKKQQQSLDESRKESTKKQSKHGPSYPTWFG